MIGFLLSLFFGFVPMLCYAGLVYWVDRYEKEPRILLGGVFFWGAVVAAGAAFVINTALGVGVYLVTNSEGLSNLTTGSLVAPVVEETLKGLAVLIVFLVFRTEFDTLLDGIIYAAITALGFAATENVYYIYSFGYARDGLTGLFGMVFVRVILVGWQHPFYTAFTGVGLATARLSRSSWVKAAAPLGGFILAVTAHSIHNTIAEVLSGGSGIIFGTLFDWTGWIFMLIFIIWAVYRERRWIKDQLQEEVAMGLITPGQYATACSATSQGFARLGAMFNGRYVATDRFYQTCAELAFKKQQKQDVGEEGHNSQIIQSLRDELVALSPKALS